jgi:hypothetical protein
MDVSGHYVKLRREKMQKLKHELEQIGATIDSRETDPAEFTGIRRLRMLYAKAHEGSAGHIILNQGKTAKIPPKLSPLVPKARLDTKPLPADLNEKKTVVKADGFIAGYTQGQSVAIVVGSSFTLLLLSYIVYKYVTWKPKLIARKGYRAVAKSKGISGVDSEDSATPAGGGVLRASSKSAATSSVQVQS